MFTWICGVGFVEALNDWLNLGEIWRRDGQLKRQSQHSFECDQLMDRFAEQVTGIGQRRATAAEGARQLLVIYAVDKSNVQWNAVVHHHVVDYVHEFAGKLNETSEYRRSTDITLFRLKSQTETQSVK